MAGPQQFAVDQAQTFDFVMLMGVEPKLAFKSTEQETTKDGTPKWEAHLSAGFKSFGQTQYTMIKVSVVAESNPGDSIAPGTPVQLLGFVIGVMDKTVKDKDTGESKTVGAQVWYRADEIRSTAATGPPASRGKTESAKADASA